METPHLLDRPEGRIAYRSHGAGPVVLLVPGVGDASGVYRDPIPLLVADGYRVVTADPRGHGESDTIFTIHGLSAVSGSIVGLVGQLDEPVVVVGSSVSATALPMR